MLAAPAARNLRNQITTSAKLSTAQYSLQILLRLVSTVVLTRLLVPEIYGVFALVLMYLYLLNMFSDIGFRSLILTKEGDIDSPFLSSCWVVSIARGALLAIASCAIAATIAWVQTTSLIAPDSAYSDATLPLALAALGGIEIIKGLQAPWRYIYEKDMRFARVTLVTVATSALVLVITIAAALWLRSIWALVLGALSGAVFRLGASFLFFKGPPLRFSVDRTSLGLLVSRGKWIVSHSSLTVLSGAADRLFFGFVMTSSTFGMYYIARQILDLADGLLNAIHGRMGLQVFGQILASGDAVSFRNKYYRYRLFFDLIAGGFAGSMVVLAPLAVDIVFDDRYAGAAPILQILAVGVLLTSTGMVSHTLGAERRFRALTYFHFIRAATLWAGLLVTVVLFSSVQAALFVIALHRLPEIILLLAWGRREGRVRLINECRILVIFAATALVSWLIILPLSEFLW